MTESNAKQVATERLLLAVRLGENVHAIPIEWVEEVLPALPVESVPQCPEFVRGVVFVRGHVIPVVSAAERLGIRNYERPLEPHIVCLRIGERLVGVEFDEALDLIDLRSSAPLAADDLGARGGFFAGVVEFEGEIIRLLDPAKLVVRDEAAQLSKVLRTE